MPKLYLETLWVKSTPGACDAIQVAHLPGSTWTWYWSGKDCNLLVWIGTHGINCMTLVSPLIHPASPSKVTYSQTSKSACWSVSVMHESLCMFIWMNVVTHPRVYAFVFTCIWTQCNQQCDQKHCYAYIPHYWNMPPHKYACHTGHVCPTACLLYSTYGPNITPHISIINNKVQY